MPEQHKTKDIPEEALKLSQLSQIVKINKPTLHARIKAAIPEAELYKNLGKQIFLFPTQVKKILADKFSYAKGKIIVVGNLKGGVGKTTIAYLLSNILRLLGMKVCIIDTDIQSNLTTQFLPPDSHRAVFHDLVEGTKTIQEVIVPISEYLHIIPSSLKNSLIPKTLAYQSAKNHHIWLNDLCLTYLRNTYDIVIVDTPPSLTTLNSVFSLCLDKNDHIVIPVCAEDFSVVGVQMFLDDILEIKKAYRISLDTRVSIIMNRFFQTQRNNLEMLVKMSNIYRDMLSEVVIKDSAKIREIINSKMSFHQIKNGKEVYDILCMLLNEINVMKQIEVVT